MWRQAIRHIRGPAIIWSGLMLLCAHGIAQKKASKVFFLKNSETNQWCAFNKEAKWNATAQHTCAMTVGTLGYSKDHLSQIDVTETDQSGDWTVYDRYFLDARGRIVKLSRLVNVLPGDWSVLQTFSISDAKARKIGTTMKQLSTGKLLT